MVDPPTQDFISACSKVGELVGLLLVLQLSTKADTGGPAIDQDELLTRKQAAKRMSVSVSTFDGWRRQGVVQPVKGLGERTVRYRASDIDRLIARK